MEPPDRAGGQPAPPARTAPDPPSGRAHLLILAWAGIAVVILAVLSVANSGGSGGVFESLYLVVATASAAIALLVVWRRAGPARLRYGPLVWAVVAVGAGTAVLKVESGPNLSFGFLVANVLFIAGTVPAFVVIMPALYRNLDRRDLAMTALDGGIIWAAGTTLMLTLWRASEDPGGPDRLFAPVVAAAVLASAGTAVMAAFAKRWRPTLGGVWFGIPGVFILGLAWTFFVDAGLHGLAVTPVTYLLCAAGTLCLGFGWTTWTDDTLRHVRYDRLAATVSDWLPIVAVLLCVSATALPHSRMLGADVTWAGTATVVVMTLVRQRLLISREREATRRLVGEEHLRADKEAAEASDLAKSEFLAMMSHEIRTPLNAILGNAHLLDEGHLSEDQLESVQAISVSGQTLLSVINDVLDFSKIEANRMQLERIGFRVEGVVQSVASLFAIGARSKGLSLTRDIDPALPEVAAGDPYRLRQILFNLVGNALKFTSHGGVAIRARLAVSGPESSLVRFEIADTGIGISPEEKRGLFAPFCQADASTTRRFGGTGLGLAICRNLVALMGGEIGMESEKGAGSTFWFTARLACPTELEVLAARTADGGPPLRSDTAGARVLVADDNAANLRLAERLLDRLGVKAVPAADGRTAIAEIEAGGIDLVLMDIHMPEMDGLEATRLIRAGGVDVPIIALTADATARDRTLCLEAGMNDYLSKPIRQADLAAALRTWLPSSGEARSSLGPAAGGEPIEQGVVIGSRQILNSSRLEELIGLDPDGTAGFLVAMVDSYRATLAETLPVLRSGVSLADSEMLEEAAHKLKGVAGNMGVGRVFEASSQLVALARSGSMDGVASALADLEAAVQPADVALSELLLVVLPEDQDTVRRPAA